MAAAPPGDNLEFTEGPQFKERVKVLPELAADIVALIRCWPGKYKALGNGFGRLDLEFKGVDYAVILRKVRHKLQLLNIYRLPHEEGLAHEKEEQIKNRL